MGRPTRETIKLALPSTEKPTDGGEDNLLVIFGLAFNAKSGVGVGLVVEDVSGLGTEDRTGSQAAPMEGTRFVSWQMAFIGGLEDT